MNYVEKFAPEFIPNLSTARSPMQMMGPVLKADFEDKGGKREDLIVVAVMPCSAKKSEAKRGEFLCGQQSRYRLCCNHGGIGAYD